MRKIILWVLVALMILSAAAFAESVEAAQKISINSFDAVRTATDLYLAVPAKDAGEVLVRLPLGGGDAICVDTADKFEDLTAYSGGAAYLKTVKNATSIACCVGNNVSTLYGFGTNTVSDLSVYGDELLVLNGGLLFSINPNRQTSLRLSSAQMLEYVLGQDCAYYISDADKMEYTAQLGDDTSVAAQAGCIYRLDLKTAETELLLKSGCTDLQISGANLFFHNLADAYAMRPAEGGDARLCGRLYSLDSQLKTLNKECAEPDNGFRIADDRAVVLFNGALNVNSEGGNVSLYAPEDGASVYSDGDALYVWEPGKTLLTEVRPNGETKVLYEKNLAEAVDLTALIPIETPETETEPATDETPAETTGVSSDWFDTFVANTEAAEKNTQKSSADPAVPAAQSTAVKGSTVTTTEGVKLRSGGGSNFSQIGSVPAGTSMTCLGSTTSSTGTTWYEVNYNGVTGYIYAGYAELSGGVNPAIDNTPSTGSGSSSGSGSTNYSTYNVSGKYAHIKNGSVNMRKGPGTAFGVITSIPNGAYVTFKGKGATNSDGSHWYKVSYDGSTGWISKKYATITDSKGGGGSSGGTYDMDGKYVYTVDGSVHVRKSANKDSKSLGTVSKGTYLNFKGKGSTDSRGVRWYKVEYKGGSGWVSSRYCVVKNSKDGGGGDDYVKTTGSVNLRKGPGLDYDTCGSVKSGKKLEYVGETKKDGRGVRWYKVKYNGKSCWVSSRYSTLIS